MLMHVYQQLWYYDTGQNVFWVEVHEIRAFISCFVRLLCKQSYFKKTERMNDGASMKEPCGEMKTAASKFWFRQKLKHLCFSSYRQIDQFCSLWLAGSTRMEFRLADDFSPQQVTKKSTVFISEMDVVVFLFLKNFKVL